MSDPDAKVIDKEHRHRLACRQLSERGGKVPALAWVQLVIGVAATLGVLITWHQKNTADRRGEWWRGTAWAFERSLSDKKTEAKLGWTLLVTLVESKLVAVGEHVALGGFDDKGGCCSEQKNRSAGRPPR